MNEYIDIGIDEAKVSMKGAITYLQKQLSKVRAGKANPSMLNSVSVEAYGAQMPLNQISNISTPDARTLAIQPFDKSTLQAIERGIMMANIGLTPQNDGETIRLNIPPLTEERRKELVKQTRALGENCKISLRSARRDAMAYVKSLKDEGLSKDQIKDGEASIEIVVKTYASKVDGILSKKEEEIMTV